MRAGTKWDNMLANEGFSMCRGNKMKLIDLVAMPAAKIRGPAMFKIANRLRRLINKFEFGERGSTLLHRSECQALDQLFLTEPAKDDDRSNRRCGHRRQATKEQAFWGAVAFDQFGQGGCISGRQAHRPIGFVPAEDENTRARLRRRRPRPAGSGCL